MSTSPSKKSPRFTRKTPLESSAHEVVYSKMFDKFGNIYEHVQKVMAKLDIELHDIQKRYERIKTFMKCLMVDSI